MNSISEIILSILKILPPLLLISFVSLFFAKILKINNIIEKVLLIFLLNWVQIILSIQILSIFKIVNNLSLIIIHSIFALVCLIISIFKKISFKFNLKELQSWFYSLFNKAKFSKIIVIIIIVWLTVIILTTFFMGVIWPSGNYDSMTYHLARVGFWRQYQSIDHYFTRYAHQNDYPVNASVGMFWIMTFTNSDIIAFTVQWVSFIIILLCFYKLLRLLNYNRIISLITVFVFSTFDIVILEATSTQNDLVITSFIILAIFFLIKSLNESKTPIKYMVFSGFAAGLAIGTKGYSYLFIPGFIIFMFLYIKNNNKKYVKSIYIILFSILGIILFASYNLIQNYITYRNIFGCPELIEGMRMQIFGLKAFLSNLTRHIFSFYQGSPGLNFFTNFIQKLISFFHYKLNFDISNPATTWPGVYWVIFNLTLNYDTSYFGPIFFFVGFPSIIYSSILFVILKKFRKNNELGQKYKNSLIISIIPICFFVGYVFLFTWHIWAGRYMVAFVLLLMVNFSEFLELIKKIKLKALFNIVALLLVIASLSFSTLPLFRNEYLKLIDFKGENIFSKPKPKNDSETVEPVGRIAENFAMEKKVDELFGTNSSLGLILDAGDWVYIFFGRDFSRKLTYITDEEWNRKEIKQILIDNNFDGLLVNTKVVDFYNGKLEPIINKLKRENLLEIDQSNFNEYFEPLSGCSFLIRDDHIFIEVHNHDPYFETTFPFTFDSVKSIGIILTIESSVEAITQVFFGYKGKVYREDYSERFKLLRGENEILINISDIKDIVKLRIDPINVEEDVIIKKVEIFEITDEVKYEIIGDLLLFYK